VSNAVKNRRLVAGSTPGQKAGRSLGREEGIGLFGLLIAGLVFAIIGLFVLRVMPAYSEYFGVVESFKSLESTAGIGNRPASEIRRDLQAKFVVNNIESISARDVKLTQAANGGKNASVEYEVRNPLIWNFDIVIKLKREALLRP